MERLVVLLGPDLPKVLVFPSAIPLLPASPTKRMQSLSRSAFESANPAAAAVMVRMQRSQHIEHTTT
jgi:hypothetical protein